ncbi:MAG: glutamyl-tRNA reductase, partial [Betaproteobacteria bacterium]|nr:glutamyl-tRNA reductase [Betaproteobacteria bacterium]
MPLFALGLNYRTAPIEVRERIAFSLDAQRPALDALKSTTMADEVALVSTCNRTEIYLRANDDNALRRAEDWLAAVPTLQGVTLSPHLYTLTEQEVSRHLF